jgi:hypothetical protein
LLRVRVDVVGQPRAGHPPLALVVEERTSAASAVRRVKKPAADRPEDLHAGPMRRSRWRPSGSSG